MLERCAVYDRILKVHIDDYESTPYSLIAEQYLDDLDRLSGKGKLRLAGCWVVSMANQKDLTFGLHKYGEIMKHFVHFRQKMGEDFLLFRYTAYKVVALEMAVNSCLRAEYAKKHGITLTETIIDLKKRPHDRRAKK